MVLLVWGFLIDFRERGRVCVLGGMRERERERERDQLVVPLIYAFSG